MAAMGILLAVLLSGGVSVNSGLFVMKTEGYNNDGWTFAAGRANGHSTVTRDFSREALDSLVVDSSIGGGEMALILSQGNISQTIDLSGGELSLSAEELGVSAFSPGRIRMWLEFGNAENVSVKIGWR
ncbi:MAG: hypothetical protein FWE77_03335 [Clostridia bacterium]|nr:hypothetical protein [Clostridia bacterium]